MKYLLVFTLLIGFNSYNLAYAQNTTAKDFGFQQLNIIFNKDTVDILVKSKPGEEKIKKPIFFFCQGSLPQPLIKLYQGQAFGTFPFSTDTLLQSFHLVIVSKPGVPLIADITTLTPDFCYKTPDNKFPDQYTQNNYLNFYVDRNIEIIKFLQKKEWVDKKKLIVCGHSEGSTIAANMTYKYKKITHLIYTSGNPCGRINSIIHQARAAEKDTFSSAENSFEEWRSICNDIENKNATTGDSYKTTYSFSLPVIDLFKKSTCKTLICYGTKDTATPFNDYWRTEAIRLNKKNFEFNVYVGLDHNYFGCKPSGEVNYDDYNWDKVAKDWLKWLGLN